MHRIFRIMIIQMLLCFSVAASAQMKSSDKFRPQWMKHPPVPTNMTFTYENVYSEASTLDMAREKNLSLLISGTGLENGVVVVSSYTTDEDLSQTWINGKLSERLDYTSKTHTKAESKAVSLHIKEIAEYWERDTYGNYCLTKLYAKSNVNSAPVFDDLYLTSNYGGHSLWRSMLVPGWGQMHKGAYVKGSVILGGTIALAGGIIFTENMRQSCLMQMSQTHSAPVIKQLSANMTNWSVGRNVCIGAVAALYAYNLVDAVVAPGARRVVVTPGYMAVNF